MNVLENDNNIDLPPLYKNNSCKIEIRNEKITVLKAHSLIRENSNENPGVLKLKNLINNLIKLNLNMNICYLILEEMQLEKDFNLENTLSLVVEKYFSKDFEDFYLKTDSNPKKQKQNIFIKMFNKIQINENKNKFNMNHSLFKKSNSVDEKNIPHVILQMASNSDIHIDIKEEIKQEENSKLCEICYENQYYENYFPIIKHNFCKFCLLNYLKNMIFSSNILEIKCPDGCGEVFTDEKISLILKFEEDLYSKYLKFKTIYQLNQDPNGTWCVHENCDNFIKCDVNSTNINCPKCNREMCFQCKNIWHPNITCEQALDKDLKNYEEKVQIKKCPKCKSRIEKNEGCNHMTCTRCKYEFCWLCGSKYSTNHFEWYNLCGCPNMQNRNMQDRCLLCKIRVEKLFKFLFYTIAAILFFLVVYPLGMVIGVFVLPIYITKKEFIPYRIKSKKGPLYYFLLFLGFIIGLILSPIVLLLELVPGMCFLFIYLNHAGDS